jgi:hypothetical protein
MTTGTASPLLEEAPNVNDAPQQSGSAFGESHCWRFLFLWKTTTSKVTLDGLSCAAQTSGKQNLKAFMNMEEVKLKQPDQQHLLRWRTSKAWRGKVQQSLHWANVVITDADKTSTLK